MAEPVFTPHPDDGEPLFEGWTERECGDHHTVGSHRAWCFDCSEWCYPIGPDFACKGCRVPALEASIQRVVTIDPAQHATGSRDFGRGFNHAMRLVYEALGVSPEGVHRESL